MNWSNRVLFTFNLAMLVGFGWFIYRDGLGGPPSGWDWKDLVTILLTAVTVILAATALFVAILAVWGYNTIREHAKSAAEATAREVAKQVAESVAARTTLAAQETTVDGGDDLAGSLKEGGQ